MEILADHLRCVFSSRTLSTLQLFLLFTLSIRFVATLLRSCESPKTEPSSAGRSGAGVISLLHPWKLSRKFLLTLSRTPIHSSPQEPIRAVP
jgi:hypothetical protein